MRRPDARRSFLFVVLLACVGRTAAQVPFLRVDTVPAHVIVGQPVNVAIDVLVPNFFTGAPSFPQFDLTNAIVVMSEETPQHINMTVHGQFFAGIRQRYIIYPEQSGKFTLPPAQIQVAYAAHPPEATKATLTLPPRTFQATIPIEAQNLDYFLPTIALRLDQKWSTSPKGLKVGDSLDRTITVTTVRLQAMFIPPLAIDAPEGIRAYPESPIVEDQKTDRGEFVRGRRIERVTYLIEKAGQFTLPQIDLPWWDLVAGKMRAATLPAVTVTATVNPNYVAEIPPEAPPASVAAKRQSPWKRYKRRVYISLALSTAIFLLTWFLIRYGSSFQKRWKKYRKARQESESACFNRLSCACKSNDANSAYRFLLQWVTRSRESASLEDFVRESNDPEIRVQVGMLTAFLFSDSEQQQWSGHRLLSTLKRQRRAMARRPRQFHSLPELNP